jgi:DUF4097 and DUF4098 domain-containing protein YvlB
MLWRTALGAWQSHKFEENFMKKAILLTFLSLGIAGLVFAGKSQSENKYKFEEKDEIRQTLKFQDPAKPKALQVDNVFGSIDVQAYDGSEVELVAHKTIRAKTQDKIQKAKTDVKLDITADGGDIDIYVDGPFRCQCQDGKGINWRDRGYEVSFDFILKVPRRTGLTLKTVNGGDVTVKGVENDFDVSNVNGKITMENVSGSGEAHTVNGEVKVGFTKNPGANCSFRSINGDVALSFRDGLSADFKMKTFNGEAFSDFEVKSLPVQAEAKESRNGRFVYKRKGFTRIRIGGGGPEITCDTLNGDILIKKIELRRNP